MRNTIIRIAVAGANGRMGRYIIRAIAKSEKVALGAALSRTGSELCGIDSGQIAGIDTLGVKITDNLAAVKEDFDILIDFTQPDASMTYLEFCCRHRKGIIIGTTGFNNAQKKAINAAAKKTGIVFAANFSIGVNLMLKLLEKATQVIGARADIEIIEAHHRYKVDVPSGTALAMGETIAITLGRNLADCAVYSHKSYIGGRKDKSIGFAAVRAGDIVGEHTAIFAEMGERLEITHKASSRIIFASGAVYAAVWLSAQKNGLFNMVNVLGLDKL